MVCTTSEAQRKLYVYASSDPVRDGGDDVQFALVTVDVETRKAFEFSRGVLARFPGLGRVCLDVGCVVWAPDSADVSVLGREVVRTTSVCTETGVHFEGIDRSGRRLRTAVTSWAQIESMMRSPLGVAFQPAEATEVEPGERLIALVGQAWRSLRAGGRA